MMDEMQDMLNSINSFLDETVVLPPGDWDKKNLLSMSEIQELKRKKRIRMETMEKLKRLKSIGKRKDAEVKKTVDVSEKKEGEDGDQQTGAELLEATEPGKPEAPPAGITEPDDFGERGKGERRPGQPTRDGQQREEQDSVVGPGQARQGGGEPAPGEQGCRRAHQHESEQGQCTQPAQPPHHRLPR